MNEIIKECLLVTLGSAITITILYFIAKDTVKYNLYVKLGIIALSIIGGFLFLLAFNAACTLCNH